MMDLRKLIAVGAHFGHQTSRWCPKMERYIWGQRNNVHLIDVSKTALEMDRAAQFLKEIAGQGKGILWVGTKKSAQNAIRSTAESLDMPFVTHRWVGGILSNYTQVKKSVTKLLHFEDVVNKADKFPHYTKKEINVFSKALDRLAKSVGGIKKLSWPLGALVVVDVNKERSAIKEAISMGIPVVAVVDTNGDPSGINYVIPANDDSPRVVSLIVSYLSDAVKEGKEQAHQRQPQEAAAAKEEANQQLEDAEKVAARAKSGARRGRPAKSSTKQASEASTTESADAQSETGVAAE
ncbi:30S ribosomal protein S2 [Candidatus Dependentiae bacterium]|nr:30S ribosomal protein S2 [Candidatus Dependentiae bacterium]